MKPISLALLIASWIALGFFQGSIAATREDLIEAAKKERQVVFYTTTNLEEAAAMSGRFKAKYPFLDVNIDRAEVVVQFQSAMSINVEKDSSLPLGMTTK